MVRNRFERTPENDKERTPNELLGRRIVQMLYGTNDETWEGSTGYAMREWWAKAGRVAEILDPLMPECDLFGYPRTPKETLANARRVSGDNANIAVKVMGMLAKCQQKFETFLDEVEWSVPTPDTENDGACPSCFAGKPTIMNATHPHMAYCKLAAARKLLARQKETKLYN